MADNQPAARVITSLASLSTRHAELKKAFKAMFFDPITLEEYNVVLTLEDQNGDRSVETNANYMRSLLKVRKFEAGNPFDVLDFRRDIKTLSQAMGSILNVVGQFDRAGAAGLGTTSSFVPQDGSPNPVYVEELIAADMFRGLEVIKLEFATLFRMMSEVIQRTLRQVPDTNDEIVHNDLEVVALATADLIEAILARPNPNFADPALGLSETVETLPGLNITDVISGSFDYLTAPLVFGEAFHTTVNNLMFFITGPNGEGFEANDTTPTKDWLEFEKSFDFKKAALQDANPLLPIAVNIEISKALGSMLTFYNAVFLVTQAEIDVPVFQTMQDNWRPLLSDSLRQLGQYFESRDQALAPLLTPALIASTVRWSVGPFKRTPNDRLSDIYDQFDACLSQMANTHKETDDPLGWMVMSALRVVVDDWYDPDARIPPVVSIKETRASREPLAEALQRFLRVKDTEMTRPVRINDNSHHLAIVDILNNFAFFRPDVGTLEEICRLLVTVVLGTNFATLPQGFDASAWLEARDLQVVRVDPQGVIGRAVLTRDPNAGQDDDRPFTALGENVELDPFSLYAEFAKGGRMVLRGAAQPNNAALTRIRQRQEARRRQEALTVARRNLRQQQIESRNARNAVQVIQNQQDQLEAQLQDVQQEEEEARQEIAALREQNRIAQETIEELRSQATEQTASVFQLENALQESADNLSATEAERDRANRFAEQAQNDMDSLRARIREVETERANDQRRINELEIQVVSFENTAQQLQEERQAIIDNINAGVEEEQKLEAERDVIQQEVAGIDSSRVRASVESQNALELLDVLEDALNGIVAQEEPNQAEIDRLREEIRKKTAESQALQDLIAKDTALLQQRQQALDKATARLAEQAAENDQLRIDLEKVGQELEIANNDLALAEARIAQLEDAGNKAEAIIQATQKELSRTEEERDQFISQVENAQTKIDELQEEVAQRDTELDNLKERLTELEQVQLDELNAQRELAEEAERKSETIIDNQQQRIQELEDNVDALIESLNETEAALEEAKQAVEEEDQDVSDAESEVEELEEENTGWFSIFGSALTDVRRRLDKTIIGINLLSNPYDNGEVQFYFETLERLGSLVYSFNRRIVDNWVSRPVLSATERFDEALEDYFLNGNAPGLYRAIDALRTALDDQVNQNILDRLSVVDSLCGFITP